MSNYICYFILQTEQETEIFKDPFTARNGRNGEEESIEAAGKSQTASKMLSMFRQMEETKQDTPRGL